MAETPKVTEEAVLEALATVQIPELGGGDLVSRQLVRDVKLCEGNVAFDLPFAMLPPPLQARIEKDCRTAVTRIPGVTGVNVRITGPRPEGTRAPAGAPSSAGGPLPGIRHMVAVGSGKGGVGKSTVAVNLAVALAAEGWKVGLLDADVYGPSIPTMMGIHQPPFAEDGQMIPLERHGVLLMSLGFLMKDETAPYIARGPMASNVVAQMLQSRWGELDVLLVDLPPGTGDVHLTLAQTVPMTGAVVVMTSQDVAVRIASKAVGMFEKLNVPILGVVGNMDAFACPHCGIQTPIFTRGGSEEAARQLGVPFLGSIPLDPETVEHGDAGTPTVIAAPDSAQAEAFRAVARTLAARLRPGGAEETDAPEPRDPLGGLLNRFRKTQG